ncbi:MAG: hypothetical protein LM550_00605 [Candidatus Contendobacter sp.]|jgi:tetratricopeptide (TPR) repeat protein|nr:hypothetical protein [Gammaproteobacteria bacterium]MCC8992209.1 hypothetical protein [Candidatus Contendobacter sp.]
MNLDRPSLAHLRERAAQARRLGHYAQAAQWERKAVELAETLGLASERARALLWEGHSLRQAGDDDLALAALLQALNAPAIDSGDRFSALIAVLHISLERKSAGFCRALLAQGRRELAESRQPWSTLLDFLEGELAFRRGDFAAARDWQARAWAGRRDAHPRLTPATYLWALCRTAFRRREWLELEGFTRQLCELQPNSTLERQLAMRAQWLVWRARRVDQAVEVSADQTPVAQAQTFLARRVGEGKPRDFGARLEALRVVALVGDWNRIDTTLRHEPLHPVCFETALGLGDLAVSRVRAALGLSAVDDDYGETGVTATAAPAATDSVAARLREGEQCYQDALRWAEEQDQRLGTDWYSDTVRQRLARLPQFQHVTVTHK